VVGLDVLLVMITEKLVCHPFITGNGEGCRITLRLPPLVTLYIAASDVWTNVDDVVSKIPKMLKNKANATREIFMFLHNTLPLFNGLNIYHHIVCLESLFYQFRRVDF
jgi:hypothetical protein